MPVPMFSASLAVHPAAMSIDIVFLLPDWQADFHLVDDVSARGECLVTMRRGHSNPYRTVADFQQSRTVHTADMQQRKIRPGLGNHLLPFLDCNRLIDLVFQSKHFLAVVVIANPSFETDVRAGRTIDEFITQFVRFDFFRGNTHAISRRLPVGREGRCRHR